MADYEEYKDNPTKKSTKAQKRYTLKRFRREGKYLLDNARIKYQGILTWYW